MTESALLRLTHLGLGASAIADLVGLPADQVAVLQRQIFPSNPLTEGDDHGLEEA